MREEEIDASKTTLLTCSNSAHHAIKNSQAWFLEGHVSNVVESMVQMNCGSINDNWYHRVVIFDIELNYCLDEHSEFPFGLNV